MICASCGAENREGARFCDSCGAALAEAAPAREMRKVVTVLFCDVTGSTALGERIDPESLRRVMARYFETAKAIVERHGGTVEKFIGDAVMAVFGVPTVHEDDALRAVRAADELRGGARRAERRARGRLRHAARAAHGRQHRRGRHRHRGAARDRRRGQRRRAARAGGQPGEVLLGEETYRLVRDGVEAEAAPPIEAKGKSEPLAAYRLVSVQAEAPGAPPRGAHGRPRAAARAARGRVRQRRQRPLVPPVHDPRHGGRRQVAPRAGVPRRASTRRSSAAAASPTARGSATGR